MSIVIDAQFEHKGNKSVKYRWWTLLVANELARLEQLQIDWKAQAINKSLSALGDVIGSLTSSEKHIPYRNHKLTMLLSDSLGGNAKTLMFVNASPADYNTAETNNALKLQLA